jgi:hypothetical protein
LQATDVIFSLSISRRLVMYEVNRVSRASGSGSCCIALKVAAGIRYVSKSRDWRLPVTQISPARRRIAQLRESAQFVEMPIQPVCREHVGPPARFHETRRHMFGQRALATDIEVAEQIESLQQFSRGRCCMEFKLHKDAPRTTSRTYLRSSDGAHPIQHF